MLLTVVAFLIAAAALAAAIFFVAKHWKQIRLLDPQSIREERLKAERAKVIERRFERVTADRMATVSRFGREFGRRARERYDAAIERLQSLDKVYRTVTSPLAAIAPSQRERIKTLLTEARSLMRDLKWADAERRCLEILSLDARQAEAYKLLGQIYLKQKLYPQAKETFEYLVKTKKADDATYAGLAEIHEASGGDLSRAEAMRLKAVEASPRQPHRQAEAAQFFLARGEAGRAWPFAKRASELEPQSAKYLELSLETAILLGDRNEAEGRYRRLRLLSDDPNRFQTWKEKIESLPEKPGKRKLKNLPL
jgi:tetratricopeptide (TPR) repeat protein